MLGSEVVAGSSTPYPAQMLSLRAALKAWALLSPDEARQGSHFLGGCGHEAPLVIGQEVQKVEHCSHHHESGIAAAMAPPVQTPSITGLFSVTQLNSQCALPQQHGMGIMIPVFWFQNKDTLANPLEKT